MQSKKIAVFAALSSVAALMQKLNDNYGSLNSQDADFKNIMVEVNGALALPDDPEVVEVPPLKVMFEEDVRGIIAELMPAPLDVPALVAGITEQIEHSDLTVLGAIAETRGELVAALKPAA